MGKSLGSDILSKKQTVLTIIARKIVPKEWSKFCYSIEDHPIKKIINMLRSFFDQHNIYSEAKSLSDKYLQDGLDNLLFVPESNREELKLFTNYLKNREY